MADKLVTVEELIKLLDSYNHKELHVHHTWKPAHSNFNGSNHQKVQDGMRNTHKNLGWGDIGQHVTLFPDGKFMLGRAFGKNPASISGYNTGAFAVEMVGNFDNPNDKGIAYNNLGYDKFEGKQKEAMLKLAHYFDVKRKKYVRFHRENAAKTCPGTSIDKNIFMKEAREIYNKAEVVPMTVKTHKGHWAEQEIERAIKEGLLNGRPDGFYPNEPMTRAEVAVVMVRLLDKLKG